MVPFRAVLDFDLASEDALAGCRLELETTDGRRYSTDPAELGGLFLTSTLCRPLATDDAGPTTGSRSLRDDAWFVLPPGATPRGLRVVVPTQQPRYAVLRPPAPASS
jgi:hypothetical protein